MDLQREPTVSGATLGALYLDGVWVCWTLEDPVRELAGVPVADWKIAGSTAIPTGAYTVEITYSQRFKRDLPLVVDVPGFTGIRLHPGNTSADTEGCILLGLVRGLANVGGSKLACEKVQPRLQAGATLTIHPPWPVA